LIIGISVPHLNFKKKNVIMASEEEEAGAEELETVTLLPMYLLILKNKPYSHSIFRLSQIPGPRERRKI
jgi:hypothetical protein